jgi:hypothetical protein
MSALGIYHADAGFKPLAGLNVQIHVLTQLGRDAFFPTFIASIASPMFIVSFL